MHRRARSLRPSRRAPVSRGQALVELALVMPLLVGIIAVLFQYGILFITYLALLHMGRDTGRWLAVHPDSRDSDVLLYASKDLPSSVMFPTQVDGPNVHCTYNSGTQTWSCSSPWTPTTVAAGGMYVAFSPTCISFNTTTQKCMNGTNPARPTGTLQTLTITYDAASRMFLPSRFKLGPWLDVVMPGAIQTYQYNVMVEPD